MKSKSNRYFFYPMGRAWELERIWGKAAFVWRALDYVFAIGAFAASVATVCISGAFPSITDTIAEALSLQTPQTWVIILSSLSAVLTLTGFACNPSKHMTSYRCAYERLNAVLLRCSDMEGNIIDSLENRKRIQHAIELGEKEIGKTYEVNIEVENHALQTMVLHIKKGSTKRKSCTGSRPRPLREK